MNDISERIARIIENDGSETVKRTMRVAQSDIVSLLSAFMDVTALDMSVNRTEGGEYELNITVKAARIYDVGKTTAQY